MQEKIINHIKYIFIVLGIIIVVILSNFLGEIWSNTGRGAIFIKLLISYIIFPFWAILKTKPKVHLMTKNIIIIIFALVMLGLLYFQWTSELDKNNCFIKPNDVDIEKPWTNESIKLCQDKVIRNHWYNFK